MYENVESSSKFEKTKFLVKTFLEFLHSDRIFKQFFIDKNGTTQGNTKITEKLKKNLHLKHLEELETYY